jgi:asparagine synthase (glutamine-hydrolysing)
VRLTGNYGSEILRGVSTFKPISLSPKLWAPQFPCRCWSEFNSNASKHPVTFAAFCETPWKLFGALAAGRSQVTFRTPYLDNEIVSVAYQAPECLRKSSIPAWHLIRTNSSLLGDIPTDRRPPPEAAWLAGILKRCFSEVTFKIDYLNNEGWPHWLWTCESLFRGLCSKAAILGLHKFLHYRTWFRGELATYVRDTMMQASVRQSPLWNGHFVERMVEEHAEGRKNYVAEINAVLTLEATERLLFRSVAQRAGVTHRFTH